MQNRILSLDFCKLFAMFLVIWGHCIQHLLSSHYYDEPVYRFIYSFHMPLFMTISGFFGTKILQKQLKEIILYKAQQLILPVLGYALLLSFICFLTTKDIKETKSKEITIIIGDGLWFLKSLFSCIIWMSNKFFPRKIWALIFGLIISQLPWINYYQLSDMYPFFILGFLGGNGGRELIRQSKMNNKLILLVFSALAFGLMLPLWNQEMWGIPIENSLRVKLMGDNMRMHLIFNRMLKLLIGASGVFFTFFLITILKPIIHKCSKVHALLINLSKYGKYTLGVYVIHALIMEEGLKMVLNFDGLNFYIFNFLVSPALAIILLIVCIKLTMFLGNYRYTSFLVGLKPQKVA